MHTALPAQLDQRNKAVCVPSIIQRSRCWVESRHWIEVTSLETHYSDLQYMSAFGMFYILAGGVDVQAGVHLLQTEGSKMVMALCQSSYNQGVYGLVTNLGSLVVRTIFFPVEEAAFRAFSRPPGAALPS